jgi:molybdopterin biosynthesis enzyme
MMPLSLAAAERCDAVLRIGGASTGADQEVERIQARGGKVFYSVEELPGPESGGV